MAAPGIQLNSEPQLTYFHPTIRQYLQGIKEAVMSDNLPAARQAFAQLTKAVPSPSQGSSGQTSKLATSVSEGLQAVGKALEAGDLSGVGQVVGALRRDIESMAVRPAPQQQSVAAELPSSNGSDVSAVDGSSSELGSSVNVRV